MIETSVEQLKKSFHNEMIQLYKRVSKELKHKPTRIMDLINKYGGFEAAVKYITTEGNVQDFAILWENERLDLSVEALITKEKYRSLFSEDLLSYCDRKLAQYSYAPNKVEEEEEEEEITPYRPEIEGEGLMASIEAHMPSRPYVMYHEGIAINKEKWKEVLVKSNIVTLKNLDLLLRVYLIGDQVEADDLAQEEGYSTTYPYQAVVSALGKRVKSYLQVEIPVSKKGEPLWWHIFFVGGFKDNKHFEWSLRKDLRVALEELLAENQVSLEGIEVKTQKDKIAVKEAPVIEKVSQASVESVNNAPKKVKKTISDFDSLFESIMMPEPEIVKESPVAAVSEEKEVIKSVKAPIEASEISNKEQIKADAIVLTDNVSDLKSSLSSSLNTTVADETLKSVAPINEQEPVRTISEMTKQAKKEACIDYYGAVCDLCGFDFGYTYGDAFEKMIEVHNVKVDSEEEIFEDTDPIQDLIPICHNCHHVIHSKRPAYTIEEMRKMIKA